jgi:hypothetical protein
MLVRSQQEADQLKATDQLKAFVQKGGNAEIPVRSRFALDRGQQVNVGRTATAHIPVPAQRLREVTEAAGANRLLRTLQRVEPPAAADFFVHVFVNALGIVSEKTPITDPHYAGSFAFFLNGHGGDGDGPGGIHGGCDRRVAASWNRAARRHPTRGSALSQAPRGKPRICHWRPGNCGGGAWSQETELSGVASWQLPC